MGGIRSFAKSHHRQANLGRPTDMRGAQSLAPKPSLLSKQL